MSRNAPRPVRHRPACAVRGPCCLWATITCVEIVLQTIDKTAKRQMHPHLVLWKAIRPLWPLLQRQSPLGALSVNLLKVRLRLSGEARYEDINIKTGQRYNRRDTVLGRAIVFITFRGVIHRLLNRWIWTTARGQTV